MKALWIRYVAKLDAMTARERGMVFIAGVAVILFLLWAIGIQPAADRAKQLQTRIETLTATNTVLEQQKRELDARLQLDPDDELRVRIAEAQVQIESIDSRLVAMQTGLIAPSKMTGVVKDMLARAPRLQLVALQTLPATPLVERAASTDPDQPVEAGLYKHGIEITVQGRYPELLAYVSALEAMSTQVLWNRTRVDATDYPRVNMTLVLFTLSLERTWLTL